MPGSRPLRAIAALALLLTVAGCSAADDPAGAGTPSPSDTGTPLTAYDTGAVTLAREPFCDRLDETAVEEALGGAATASRQYGNGDRTRLATGVEDVAHEFGCVQQRRQVVARAWLFAPPVTRARARELAALAGRADGCAADAGAPGFGSPSVGLLCTQGRTATASYRGLFGDAWLSCSITVPTAGLDHPALLDRTGRWCVQVAEAASA